MGNRSSKQHCPHGSASGASALDDSYPNEGADNEGADTTPNNTTLGSIRSIRSIRSISSAISSSLSLSFPSSASASASPPNASKVGAGLLIVRGGPDGRNETREALLLKRSMSSGNPGTWGLPGGNRDAGETDLWETVMREAGEEMGGVDAAWFVRLATVLTRRGKREEKEYTVYVVEMEAGVASGWVPSLNEEHTAWRWVGLRGLLEGAGASGGVKGKLHPVVKIVVREYGGFLKESLLSGGASS